jgi:ATP-dependent DNA helicase RecG
VSVRYREGEELEFKREWTDRALTDIAAFANTGGGRVFIGVGDDGAPVGCDVSDAHQQRIANRICDKLSISVSLAPISMDGVEIIQVTVHQAPHLVPIDGRYYGRIGTTNKQLTPAELGQRALRLVGRTWDAMPSEAGPTDLSEAAIRQFADLAHSRFPQLDGDVKPAALLENLGLMKAGKVLNAAVLMFGEKTERFVPTCQYQIGRLLPESDDIVNLRRRSGNVLSLLETIDDDWEHFISQRVTITGTGKGVKAAQSTEVWEYPRKALREAMLNALVHRDYTTPGYVLIKVFDDQLEIWNPGGLPPGLAIEDLRVTPHPSRPRNELLARLCHYAGLIEQFGTGTTRMISACKEQGLPEPAFEESGGGFHVLFVQDRYQLDRLREKGVPEDHLQIIAAAKFGGQVTNEQVQELLHVSKRTATRKLKELVEEGLLTRVGSTGRGTTYRLEGANRATKGSSGRAGLSPES